MRTTYIVRTIIFASLAVCGLPSANAQNDQNAPPVIEEITYSLDGNCPGQATLGKCLMELEPLFLCVKMQDANFADQNNNETVTLTIESTWEPYVRDGVLYGPEPPPVRTDRTYTITSRQAEVTIPVVFLPPEFNGPNQARLRGYIDYDVLWAVQITLVDSQGATDRAFIEICEIENPALRPGNPPPFADAGPDQTVAVNSTVTLDAALTFDASNFGFAQADPNVYEKDNITYTWEWVSGPIRVDPVAPDPVKFPAIAEVTLSTVGAYVYRVTADDGVNSQTSSDTTTVTVVSALPPNNPPNAVIIGPSGKVVVGSIVALDGTTSSDPDGDPLVFRWRQTNELGGALPPGDLQSTFQPLGGLDSPIVSWQALKAGTFYFRLLVSDGQASSTTVTTVEVVNTAQAGLSITTDAPAGAPADTSGNASASPQAPTAGACGGSLLPLVAVPFALWLVRRRVA